MSGKLKKILCARKRPGVGLAMALMMMLACSVLVLFIFQATSQFMVTTTRQREVYMHHTRLSDYIQMAKGMVSNYNFEGAAQNPPRGALHRYDLKLPLASHDRTIRTADDLRIYGFPNPARDENLSLDIELPGNQSLTMKVFDMVYIQRWLADPYPTSDAGRFALAGFPAPIIQLEEGIVKNEALMQSLTEGDDTRESSGGDGAEVSPLMDFEKQGAYLVRVELFDNSVTPKRRLRVAEESFFQLSSIDVRTQNP